MNDNWIRIVEYGDHPHSKGLQRVTQDAAQGLARGFNSLRSKLARRFGGLPIYVGHPDDPSFAGAPGHADTRAHGWVQALDARSDGLYGQVKWGETGRKLLANAHYKFLSPRWAMRALGQGVFEPVRLLSIGLTNSPNIAGDAIANAETPESETLVFDGVSESLPEESEVETANEIERLQAIVEAANQELDQARRRADELEEALCSRQQAHAGTILANAVKEALIAPHEREAWDQKFANNFDAALEDLQAQRPLLNTRARTAAVGRRREVFARRTAIVEAVNARMDASGEPYSVAWSHIKQSRPDLFQND